MKIFFATVNLFDMVHTQGLGFTTMVFKYVVAESKEQAANLVDKWATEKSMKVKKVDANETVLDVSKCTFPNQILNLPREILEREYDRRDYPVSFRDPGQYVSL